MDPQDHSWAQWFTKMTHSTQKNCYIQSYGLFQWNNTNQNQLKEKTDRVRSRRNQAQAFKCPLPVEFHEYALNSSSKVVWQYVSSAANQSP